VREATAGIIKDMVDTHKTKRVAFNEMNCQEISTKEALDHIQQDVETPANYQGPSTQY
jgi:hypothetical protein